MNLLHKFCVHFGYSTPRQLHLWWLRIFRQSYVVKMRLSREGICTHKDCALLCCSNCPWLIKKGDLFFCKNYENAPLGCKDFPIDNKKLAEMNKALLAKGLSECGFYWKPKKEV